MNDLQLEINFGKFPEGNRFRDTLNQGNFMLLVESGSPGRDHDPAAAGAKLAALEQAVLNIQKLPTALAITDGPNSAEAWRAAEYAAALSPENRDRHVLYVSGKNTNADEFETLTGMARAAGFRNLIAVSGDAVKGESAREIRKRDYTESVQMLDQWRAIQPSDTMLGAVVNPFQYSSHSLLAQYSKLVKKINSGASLIVAQAGWDMLKLQTLRWYLSSRNIFVPTIARLIVLSPERVEKILAGAFPGVNIPPDFRKILEQELQFSLNQFEAAQWRRLELQAAGCRLLGYSGIQLAGIDNTAKLNIAAERISAALKEFTSFEFWLAEYNSYMARAEMAPFTGSFYLFDRTLTRNYPETPPKMREPGEPLVSGGEKFRYHLRNFFFAHANKQHADNRRLLKNIFCGCRNCDACRLPESEFICPEQCPKRLANGPCGGIRPDGHCEIPGVGECVHRRIMRIAHWQDRAGELEDRLVRSGRSDGK